MKPNTKEQKQDCNLCDIIEKKENKTKQDKKSLRKTWVIFFIMLLIFAGAMIYELRDNFVSKSKNNALKAQNVQLIPEKEKPQIGYLAPDFALEDISGERMNLKDFRDKKPVMLVFWATWCGYCAKELPDLKIFSQKYKDNVQVIAVASGEAKRTVVDYIKEKDINFLISLDQTREAWNTYQVRGTPAHFLIDKQGYVVTMRPGLASLNDLEVMVSMIKP